VNKILIIELSCEKKKKSSDKKIWNSIFPPLKFLKNEINSKKSHSSRAFQQDEELTPIS
jgi:hypothetical protein